MSERPAESADYSLRILWSLARWIEDTLGAAELARVATEAGVRPEDFDGSTRWVSHEQLEKILKLARDLAGSDEALVSAFEYRFKESFGPFRYMIWGVSQQKRNELAVKMSEKVATRVGHFEVLTSKPNEFAFRYRSDRPESRLICLSRQVPWRIGPTVWNLPPAQLTEKACIANGDEYCEYHLRSFEGSRALPVAVGVLAGAAVGVGASFAHADWAAAVALPLLGAAMAYVLELRRTGRGNLSFAQDLNQVLRTLGESEAETRSEIAALHQRQRDWIRMMENQVTERTTTLERIVEGLDGLQESRVSSIRGFSHDLRNPLFVVRGNTQFLREHIKDGDDGEALRDMEAAAIQIETMLSKLMEVATAETGFVKLQPHPVIVAPLAEIFRRRLKALVHGRDIKVSVFCTREAPEQIVIDPLVFDRVVDNCLTNAAKYTEHGSILLEISGTPASAVAGAPLAATNGGNGNGNGATKATSGGGYLTLKLSDTGEGIPPSQVERIFRPRPATEERKRADSYGIGLSSVVRLLGQIGGRMDVMSKPDVGTTFWVHFPVAAPEQKKPAIGDDNLEHIIARVVTIRKAESP